jgi:hypothetical protein
LLGLISEAEIKAGRHALSAIVVVKSGDGANSPGSGFFELEKGLGIYNVDDDTTWLSELVASSSIGRNTETHTVSASARKKIASAQRARWAKFRAAKKKAAQYLGEPAAASSQLALCLGQALNSPCCQVAGIVISPNPWRLSATVDLG